MDKIFKYPAVQYIPLRLYESQKGGNPFNLSKPRIVIENVHNNSYYKKFSSLMNYISKEEFLNVKLYNGEVKFIKYRSHEVFMVGKPSDGRYHFFKVTKKYFYKDNLIFTFYNQVTGEKMARRRYELLI